MEAIYEYRCEVRSKKHPEPGAEYRFEQWHQRGQAPEKARCPMCGGKAGRSFSTFSSTQTPTNSGRIRRG